MCGIPKSSLFEFAWIVGANKLFGRLVRLFAQSEVRYYQSLGHIFLKQWAEYVTGVAFQPVHNDILQLLRCGSILWIKLAIHGESDKRDRDKRYKDFVRQ
jgi:hypothetical protein